MAGMIREKFPLDSVEFIGFASTAEPIREPDLPLVMPKPVTTRGKFECVPLTRPTRRTRTSQTCTMPCAGAQLRAEAQNKQIFIITTASRPRLTTSKAGPGSEILNLIYPPSEASAEATLEEAFRCSQQGIRISSFALIEEYYGMDWVGFVDRLTRLVRGVAFYCTAGDLGSTIMESYLAGKRERSLWADAEYRRISPDPQQIWGVRPAPRACYTSLR